MICIIVTRMQRVITVLLFLLTAGGCLTQAVEARDWRVVSARFLTAAEWDATVSLRPASLEACDHPLAWSPDGNYIAVPVSGSKGHSYVNGSNCGLLLARVHGKARDVAPMQLRNEVVLDVVWPSMNSISFRSGHLRPGSYPFEDSHVRHLDLSTGRCTLLGASDQSFAVDSTGLQVVRRGGTGLFLAGQGSDRLLVPGGSCPAWSPDGRFLAYCSCDVSLCVRDMTAGSEHVD